MSVFFQKRIRYTQYFMRIIGVIGLLWVWAGAAFALDIQEVRWGFDGQVVPERFNLLSVLVANPSAEAYEGALNLTCGHGSGRLGGVEEQPCYLAPFTARWVQFHPYVVNENYQWELSWRGDRKTLNFPRLGPPASVLLTEADLLASRPGGLKPFNDELFPTTLAALDGLNAVALDYVPRWPAAKRAALRDWVQAGGTALVLQNAKGEFPVFTDELACLNTPGPRALVGRGTVFRKPTTRREVHDNAFGPLPEMTNSQHVAIWSFEQSLFRVLGRHARPRHNWALIYVSAIFYLGVAGPGTLLLGRWVRDYRIVLGVLLGSVVAFGVLFAVIGQRGQGERSLVYTVSYARSLGGRQFDVTQWINLFVTRGGTYTLRHDAPHNLYGVHSDFESVNSVARNGKDGALVVDMPVFSQRAVVHQGVLTGDAVAIDVIAWKGGDRLEEFAVRPNPELQGKITEMWAVSRGYVYPLRWRNEAWSLDWTPQLVSDYFAQDKMAQFNSLGYQQLDPGTDSQFSSAEMSSIARPLMAYALGGAYTFTHTIARPEPVLAEEVQVFFIAPSPPGFGVVGKDFGRETGFTLYHVTLQNPREHP